MVTNKQEWVPLLTEVGISYHIFSQRMRMGHIAIGFYLTNRLNMGGENARWCPWSILCIDCVVWVLNFNAGTRGVCSQCIKTLSDLCAALCILFFICRHHHYTHWHVILVLETAVVMIAALFSCLSLSLSFSLIGIFEQNWQKRLMQCEHDQVCTTQ